jgi:hypothetical protein
VHVNASGFSNVGEVAFVQFANPLCGAPHDEGARRNSHARRDKRSGGDEAIVADFRPIENDRPHPDEAPVANRASVNHSGVAYRHVVTDGRRRDSARDVDDRVVLNVRARAYPNGENITAKDSAEPHARMFAEDNIANDACRGRNERACRQLGRDTV